jgi:hypothetical protein
MVWSRGSTGSWRLPSCAMPMNIGPKLYHWSCWGFAEHGRRTWKPHQPNWYIVLPCGYQGNSWPLPPPHTPTSPTSRPGWGSTLGSFNPYQHPGMLRPPRSFSRTWPPPRVYFYSMEPPREPSKPCMLALTGSSTGVIRPIPLVFRVLRKQFPLTAWSRHTSSMIPQNPLHRRTFLPVSRLAPDGGYAFQITWECSGLSGGVVWWMPQASPPT